MDKVFVQYGAGNIGRGFIGPLFARAGYGVMFIDVDMNVIDALNEKKSYTVEIVSNSGPAFETVENVSGVSGADMDAAAGAIARADCMATAVGVNILPKIAPVIAEGLRRRFAAGRADPLNIIICENLMDADRALRNLIDGYLNEGERARFHETVGLVEASIGRMVPVMPLDDKLKDPLLIRVERYGELPVDASAAKGPLPDVAGLHPVTNFAFYIRRKLFLHNMGHALTAYAGQILGCEYIWQAIGDPYVKLLAERAMLEGASALAKAYGVGMDSIAPHISDLLLRFGNRALGDTAARVGADTFRKLGANDRLAGAAAFCADTGVAPVYICAGLAAAFFFEGAPGDKGTARIREMVEAGGVEAVLRGHCGLDAYGQVLGYVQRYVKIIEEGQGADGLLNEAEDIMREIFTSKSII